MKYKLILVPEQDVRTYELLSANHENVTVAPSAICEVIAEVENHQVRMSRKMYENIEVIEEGVV